MITNVRLRTAKDRVNDAVGERQGGCLLDRSRRRLLGDKYANSVRIPSSPWYYRLE